MTMARISYLPLHLMKHAPVGPRRAALTVDSRAKKRPDRHGNWLGVRLEREVPGVEAGHLNSPCG
jgi:hypothetical protein